MQRILSATLGAVVWATTAALLAQTPPPTPQSSSQRDAAKAITVSGCIARAPQAATGTSGAAGAAGMATKFVLTNAAISAAGTTGTAGTPASSVASEYKLDADDAKLTPHVGHKVEITGTVDAARTMTQPPAASAANAPTLKVDNVKMVASTCP
jgi:hypothetical protein